MSSWTWEEKEKHFKDTRKEPEEHERIKQQMERDGIHCRLQWFADIEHSGRDDPFYVLKVTFAPDFEHLIKPLAVKVKEATSSGFHISLGNRSNFQDHKGVLRELKGIYNRYRHPKEVFIRHMYVAPSSVINVLHNDPLYKELADVVYHGTWKRDVHICMD